MAQTSPLSMYCPSCGVENPAGAGFCASCGAALAGMGDPLANAVDGQAVAEPPTGVREGIEEARTRLSQVMPEIQAVVAESMSRLSGLSHTGSRPTITAARRVALQRLPRHSAALERWAMRNAPLAQRWWGQRAMAPQPAPIPHLPMPTRVLWFIFAGSWLTILWILATWVTMCTVVGVPLAQRMLDLVPTVLTLRPADVVLQRWRTQGGLQLAARSGLPQHDLPTRAIYFFFVGWWASLVWMILAYGLSLTAIGLPVGYRMFALTPMVAHLERQ